LQGELNNKKLVERSIIKGRIMMAEVIARVISQKGTCVSGHKVGDEFVIGQTTPSNLCSWAFYTIFPFAEVLQFGGAFPWEKNSDATTVACPDSSNPVVLELSRSST
jgi:uncharacterized repeat protein (TIGR04076 family)